MSRTGSQPADVLERFLAALVQQISTTRPEYLTSPFTVAEIYQDLVPYRSHRDVIGVEMNGDYEEALFRMLSGEGDCLVLDSDVARREIQAELATSNPNTALFREFAAVDVRLHPSRVPLGDAPGRVAQAAEPRTEVESESESEVESEPEVELEPEVEPEPEPEVELESEVELGPEVEPEPEVELEPEGTSEDGVVGHIETASVPPVAAFEESGPDENHSGEAHVDARDVVTVCHWCREDLPVRDSIHFCPFCGSDLRPSPCSECGEAMEARWQFCVACGADVRG